MVYALKAILAVVVALIFSGGSLLSQSKSTSRQGVVRAFDEMLSKEFGDYGPGAVALVYEKGALRYKRAFGLANMELDVPMREDMVFQAGSVTKQFTAIAIMMLVERGQVALKDPITKYIEDFPTRGFDITIRHLLTHTSGIPNYTDLEEWMGRWREDMTPYDMLELVMKNPLDFAPGEEFRYSNSGYFILGHVIEKASGRTYADFLNKYIFTPLEMTHSYYGSNEQIIGNRASGYQKVGDEYKNAEYLSMTQPYAAGALMTTVGDLLKWNNALYDHRLIRKRTLNEVFLNHQLNDGEYTQYGYGWSLREINGSPTREHSGGIFGFRSQVIYLPNEDVFVALLSNCDCSPVSNLAIRMAALAIGKPMEKKELHLADGDLIRFEGVYEFPDNTQRIITFDDGQLFSQRSGGAKYPIYPFETYRFFFRNSFAELEFVTDAHNNVLEVVSSDRGPAERARKTNKPLPMVIEANVAQEVLETYVGTYQVRADFRIEISLENGRLMTQATSQEKYPLFAESNTVFFLKVVYAKVEFLTNNGAVTGLKLIQGDNIWGATRLIDQ